MTSYKDMGQDELIDTDRCTFNDILVDDCIITLTDYMDYYTRFALALVCTRVDYALCRVVRNPYVYPPDTYTEVAFDAVRNGDLETIQVLYNRIYFRLRIATPLGHIYALASSLGQTQIMEFLAPKIIPHRRYFSMCPKGNIKIGALQFDENLKLIVAKPEEDKPRVEEYPERRYHDYGNFVVFLRDDE